MFELVQSERTSVISAAHDLQCISWAPFLPKDDAPITTPIRAIFNHTVRGDQYLEPTEIRAYCQDLIQRHGHRTAESIVMLTSVPQLAMKRTERVNPRTGLQVQVFCTAGLGNAIAPGDRSAYDEELESGTEPKTGTINLVVLVNRKLAQPTLVELTQVVTMAKCQTLFTFGKKSMISDRIALGTGTDCMVVGGLAEYEISLRYGGLAVKLGELVSEAVHDVVLAAVQGQQEYLTQKKRST